MLHHFASATRQIALVNLISFPRGWQQEDDNKKNHGILVTVYYDTQY